MVEEDAEKLIENIDEDKVLEMLEAESGVETSRANKNRVQKKLLEDLGLFDVDLDDFDLSDELITKVKYLEYVDAESNEQPEFSEEVKQKARERLRELGLEPPDDS